MSVSDHAETDGEMALGLLRSSLHFHEMPLAFYLGTNGLTVETADASIRGDDAMAGDAEIRGKDDFLVATLIMRTHGKGIAFQCLTDRLGALATDATGKCAITDGTTSGHLQQFQIHPFPKRRDAGMSDDFLDAFVGGMFNFVVHRCEDSKNFVTLQNERQTGTKNRQEYDRTNAGI